MSKPTDWSAESLEKAAKFMRELDKSANSKAAMELARRDQDVELARSAAQSKEYELQRVQQAAQMARIQAEEQRKTAEHKAHMERQLAEHKLQLQRRALEEEDQLARRRDDDNRRKALEDERVKAALRLKTEEEIQAERRRSEEHRARLERENMKARALAEAEGRIREQRENEDLHSRSLRLRLGEERATKLSAIDAYFKHIGEGAREFLSSPAMIGAAALSVGAVFLGVWGTREGVRVAGRVLEKRLGTPPLVRETSRLTNHFALRKRIARAVGLGGAEDGGANVILRADVADRVGRLGAAVASTKANGAPFRHLLFYGPPGTGKTMLAKRLAKASGLDYAIMSGGDVGPLGKDAVTELHRIFDWASTSRRGLLLFIDEADAFLASRSRSSMSEEQRNALNALLYRTGEQSKHFMMVLATNRPGDLDAAVADRVDEALIFDLPDRAARAALVQQYFDVYITKAGEEARWGPWGLFTRSSAKIAVPEGEGISKAYLAALADRLDGFSGREISKLFISVQGEVYGRSGAGVRIAMGGADSGKAAAGGAGAASGAAGPTLTKALLEEVVAWKLREHRDKAAFADAAFDFAARGAAANAAAAARASAPALK